MSWARVLVLRSIIPTARAVAAASSSSARRSWAQMRMAPERRAQLVRDHGDELVLGAVRRLRVQARLLLPPRGLVAHPRQLQVGRHPRDEVARRERLGHVLVGPTSSFALLLRGRDHDHGHALGAGVEAQRAGQREAVPRARVRVDEDEVRRLLARGGQRGAEVDGRLRRPARLDQRLQVPAQVGILRHHEHSPPGAGGRGPAAAAPRARCARGAGAPSRTGSRPAPCARPSAAALDLERPSVRRGELARHGHAAAVVVEGRVRHLEARPRSRRP